MEPTFENVEKSYQVIRNKTDLQPKIGIICGSGLGKIGDHIENPIVFPYADLPGFHVSEVAGHKSRLLLGQLNGVNVVCMQGRFHGYEGIKNNACAFPIRCMKLLGVEKIIITHAAGGVKPKYKVGDFMVIKDHLPMFLWGGYNPLIGPNEDRFGPRFFPTNNLYDENLRKICHQTAKEIGLENTMQEGVVAMYSGPNYESVAECQFLHQFGVGSVGMSVCGEALVAGHCGIQVLAMSMITNKVSLSYEKQEVANHQEVIEVANQRSEDMVRLVKNLVLKI